MRTTFLSILLGLGLASGAAADSRTQLLSHVDRSLHFYVNDVEAESLSTTQLARIYSVLHSKRTGSSKRLMIRSIVGGSNSLFGALGVGIKLGN